MASKKSGKSGTKRKEGKEGKELQKLREKLVRADRRVDRWKSKASALDDSLGDSQSRVKKLEKRLRKLSRQSEGSPAESEIAEALAAPEVPALEPAEGTHDVPSDEWTVLQLKAEARSRGLSGYSSKSKAELLAALR